MRKVAVIGSTGMLGLQIAKTKFSDYQVVELNRKKVPMIDSNHHVQIDSHLSNLESDINLEDIDYLVNCAGLIRQKMDMQNSKTKQEALNANFRIPQRLVELSERFDFKIIQIGTDCVFSGEKGSYTETDIHDATDWYGKTKSMGEIPHKNLSVIRTSIVGKEMNSSSSILSWLLSQPRKGAVNGFTDQIWNGITVFHFARVVAGIIEQKKFGRFRGVHHLVPADKVTKETLLRQMALAFDREDIKIIPTPSGRKLDMSLSTNNAAINTELWKLAGYGEPPTIHQMILEYSLHIRSGG